MATEKELKSKVEGLTALLAQQARVISEYKNAMKASSPELQAYKTAKAKLDSVKPEYDKMKEQLSKTKTELESITSSAKTESDKNKRESQAKKLESEAKFEEDTGNPAKAQSLRDEAARIRANKKDGVEKGKSVKMTNAEQLDNYFASATVSMGPSGPILQVSEPNKADPMGKPTVYQAYIYTEPGKKGETAYEGAQLVTKPATEKGVEFGTADVIRDKYMSQLMKQYGSKQGVIDKLYNSGWLGSKSNVSTSALLAALDSAVAEYSVKQTNAFKFEGVRDFETMDEFLAQRRQGTSTTRTRTTVYGETDFRAVATDVARTLLGRELSKEEEAKLLPILNKAQRKNPDVITSTSGADGNVSNETTKTGLNPEQFLIDELAKTDEAQATKMVGFFDVFKRMTGVQ